MFPSQDAYKIFDDTNHVAELAKLAGRKKACHSYCISFEAPQ